ncbi:hypothetical protein BpHYR1_036151 [Brachionus plicatilis]|uniref:Uncharacterized protein n=1 Tax=Brachionus plicatilis TaxID=10195 RepID=A0A3M7PEU4_BRAPC|nr:hypothetical protein BpHYR1_036151 [Brachionus plicatilis]
MDWSEVFISSEVESNWKKLDFGLQFIWICEPLSPIRLNFPIRLFAGTLCDNLNFFYNEDIGEFRTN